MSDQDAVIGMDMAAPGSDRTVIVLHPMIREIDPLYVTWLESQKNVELIFQESLPTGSGE